MDFTQFARYTGPTHKVEWVPLSYLRSIREYDRSSNEKTLKDLIESISNDGLKEPFIIAYSKNDKKVLLVEGNHRLIALEKLGWTKAPATVLRQDTFYDKLQLKKAKKVIGIEPNQFGYVPGNMTPSQVGIPV